MALGPPMALCTGCIQLKLKQQRNQKKKKRCSNLETAINNYTLKKKNLKCGVRKVSAERGRLWDLSENLLAA